MTEEYAPPYINLTYIPQIDTLIRELLTLKYIDGGMSKGYLCLKCVHYIEEELEGYWQNIFPYRSKWMPPITVCRCKAQMKALNILKTKCKLHMPPSQKRLKVVINGMVKLEDMEREGERIELSDLPNEVELIAISEKYKAAADGKAAGLVIKYAVRDGRTFDQKYTKLSGQVLFEALIKLKIKDTTDLQKIWCVYKLQPMRMGFPRMIPIKEAKTQ